MDQRDATAGSEYPLDPEKFKELMERLADALEDQYNQDKLEAPSDDGIADTPAEE